MSLNSTPGDAAADSYFQTADADAYFTARGVAAWAGATLAKEVAARLGTSYLDNAYRQRWIGVTSNQNQALGWPRIDQTRNWPTAYGGTAYPLLDSNGWPIDPNTVPNPVKYAAMEAALMALSGVALQPTLTRGGQIKSTSEAVGPIREDIVYMDGAPAIDRYLTIEGYLAGLVTSTPGAPSGNIKLVRA